MWQELRMNKLVSRFTYGLYVWPSWKIFRQLRAMKLGQLQMVTNLSTKWIRCVTYPQIYNWIRFSKTPTLLKSDLRVKGYAHFSKGRWNRPSRRTQLRASGARRTVGSGRREARQQPSQGSFWSFPLCLNPKLGCFDPKSSDFSQFKPRNIIKTYSSKIIKSKLRKLEAR